MPGGRPSDFTPEIANEICERLSRGESLRSICADEESGWLPSDTTVRRWLAKGDAEPESEYGEFRRQYAHAREVQADTKFDQAWEIAQAATSENVQVARLQIDTIKWQASKLAPKKYGEKVALTGGSETDAPLTIQIVTGVPRDGD